MAANWWSRRITASSAINTDALCEMVVVVEAAVAAYKEAMVATMEEVAAVAVTTWMTAIGVSPGETTTDCEYSLYAYILYVCALFSDILEQES